MRWKVVAALLAVVVGLVWAGLASAETSSWSGRYTVRAGDSLTAIAARYGVSLRNLAAVNRIDWHEPLLIGVVLHVPSPVSAWKRSQVTYVVRVGDTLSGIALRYHLSLAQLASANRIDPAGMLLSGARLRIPGAYNSALDLAHLVETDPYRPGAAGYDISYPNCLMRQPTGQTFAIIGLNSGRPFTTNPCFVREWGSAQHPRSVYINTAYSLTLFRHITPDCARAGSSQPLKPAAQESYALGCSEAVAALGLLAPRLPLAIWLDVEADNSWSSQRSLNAATIKGILDHLLSRASRPLIGIYSNANIWREIVGRWSTLDLPEWIATGAPDPPGCPSPFAAGPVWLNQSTNGHLDIDTACSAQR